MKMVPSEYALVRVDSIVMRLCNAMAISISSYRFEKACKGVSLM